MSSKAKILQKLSNDKFRNFNKLNMLCLVLLRITDTKNIINKSEKRTNIINDSGKRTIAVVTEHTQKKFTTQTYHIKLH